MSYILEALQKSEHARQRGKVPDLNTAPLMQTTARGRRTGQHLAYALAGAAVLVLVAVLAWLRPWQAPAPAPLAVTVPAAPVPGGANPPNSAPTPQPRSAGEQLADPATAQHQSATVMPAQALPPTPTPAAGAALPGAVAPTAIPTPAAAPAIEPARAIATTPPPAMTPADPLPAPPAALAAPVTTPPATTAVPASVKSPPTPRVVPQVAPPVVTPGARPPASVREAAAAPSPAQIYRRNELPGAIRSSLPALKVSGHAYAEQAAERMAVINDRLVQEGDEAAPGVTVAHIDSDGLVLVFRGYRFRP